MLDHGLAAAAELLNRGFADYLVPIQLDKASLLHGVRQDSIDLDSSQVILRHGQAVGAALIARRGWTSRLAGMAIIPEARGQGAGRWCMARLMEQATARGERTMVLEVIEGNTIAVRLYLACGFRLVRRLVSYAASPAADGTRPGLGAPEEIDIRQMARLVTAFGLRDLPWQVSGESLAQIGPPSKAYRMGKAYVAISDPAGSQIVIRTLLVEPEARRQGQSTRLLRALMARYPEKTWRVPPLCPEEVGSAFESAGFARESLAQLQMEADLNQAVLVEGDNPS
jgi:ribosomal protein S18 acetylase RimI-like enzyme